MIDGRRRLYQYEKAREAGFLAYPRGEAYERQFSRYSSVFLYLEEDGTYSVVRERHFQGRRDDKVIRTNCTFDDALKRGKEYVEFVKSKWRQGGNRNG